MLLKKIYDNTIIYSSKDAIVVNEKRISYRDLWNNICKYATYISRKNLKSNEIVIIENTQDEKYIYLIFAIHLLGLVALPIDKDTPDSIVNNLMINNNCNCYIKKEELDNKIIDEVELYNDYVFDYTDKLGLILLSSGSTGNQKEIEYSYKIINNIIDSFHTSYKFNDNSSIIVSGPLSHAYSIMKMYLSLYYGYTFIIHNSLNICDFIKYLDYGYNNLCLCINPTFLHYLINLFPNEIKQNIKNIQMIETATAPLLVSDAKKVISLIKDSNIKFYNHYGSTELPSSCYLDIMKNGYTLGCVGKPLYGTNVEIVDDKGKVINSNKNSYGIIRLNGKSKCLQYHNGDKIPFFYPGDIGYISNGLLYVIDREKNFFNINGYKFSPVEIENIALTYEGVNECLCVYDNILKLLVVINNNFDKKILKKVLCENLFKYQVPKVIEVVSSLPKLKNGKVNRKKCYNNYRV